MVLYGGSSIKRVFRVMVFWLPYEESLQALTKQSIKNDTKLIR